MRVHPLSNDVRDLGDLLAHDEPQPRPGQCPKVAIRQHARIRGDEMIVVGSALLPSNASTISGNPRASVNKPTVIRDSSRRCLLYPGSRDPSPASVSK